MPRSLDGTSCSSVARVNKTGVPPPELAGGRLRFSTDRLVFREWWSADDASCQRDAWLLWGDPKVTRLFVARPLTQTDVSARLRVEVESLINDGVQYWPMYLRSTGELVGCCGLKRFTRGFGGVTDADLVAIVERGRTAKITVGSGSVDYELGIHLRPEFWGQRFGREAVAAVLDGAIHRSVPVPVRWIVAGHHPDNKGSARLLQNSGFAAVTDVFFPPTGLKHMHYVHTTPAGRRLRSRL